MFSSIPGPDTWATPWSLGLQAKHRFVESQDDAQPAIAVTVQIAGCPPRVTREHSRRANRDSRAVLDMNPCSRSDSAPTEDAGVKGTERDSGGAREVGRGFLGREGWCPQPRDPSAPEEPPEATASPSQHPCRLLQSSPQSPPHTHSPGSCLAVDGEGRVLSSD